MSTAKQPKAPREPVTIVVSEEEFSFSAEHFIEWHNYETTAVVLPKTLRVTYGKNVTKLLPRFNRNGAALSRWVEHSPFRGSGKRWVFRTPEEFAKNFLRYTPEQIPDLTERAKARAARPATTSS